MRVMVIGGGGREHAICWALAKSAQVKELYCAPGNGGIAAVAKCVAIQVDQFDAIAEFAEDYNIDLVVIGPDDPLAEGIVDFLEARGISAFGPNKAAAELEGSKVFTKHLLRKYQIPTAAYEVFEEYEEALAYVRQQGAPLVLKADGLAAGKGVIVAQSLAEAEDGLAKIMRDKAFGAAGDRVVIEEFLVGQEMSILAFVDGEVVRPMVAAQDHKPIFDGDLGPNTGGMGTYSPVPHIPAEQIQEAIDTIILPTAAAMVQEGRPFRGVLFAGLMMTAQGPKTIEFNARFGDPEAQVVLPRLETDFVDILLATMNGRLQHMEISWSDQAAVCVVLASGGYPDQYDKGLAITGLADVEDALVFHAGTQVVGEQLVTAGGRVLGVVGMGSDLVAARDQAYREAAKIQFDGVYYRKDIAMKALQ